MRRDRSQDPRRPSRTVPLACVKPMMVRSVVVLPAPFRPISAALTPGFSVKLTSRKHRHIRDRDVDVSKLSIGVISRSPVRGRLPDRAAPRAGVPSFWILPTLHTATRLAKRATTSMSCSTNTEVTFSSASAEVRMSMMSNFSDDATPDVGSSISSSFGLSASASAISTSLR